MAQRGNGLEGRREWFTRVKALPERACRKAEMVAFAPANPKRLQGACSHRPSLDDLMFLLDIRNPAYKKNR